MPSERLTISNPAEGVITMSLIRWQRPQTLPTALDEFNRMFEQAFRAPLWRTMEGEPFDFGPALDVYETETEVVVKAELPGVRKEDIDLTFEEDRLILRGESKHEEEVKEEGYHRRELRYGSFRRAVSLPAAVKQEEIAATFQDGILTIRAPKSEEVSTGRKIEVQ
jgi:HSP20 family protein